MKGGGKDEDPYAINFLKTFMWAPGFGLVSQSSEIR